MFVVRGSQLLDRTSRLAPFGDFFSERDGAEGRVVPQSNVSPALRSGGRGSDDAWATKYRPAVESSIDREFDGFVLCLRYGMPATLILLAVLAWVMLLLDARTPVSSAGRVAWLVDVPQDAAWLGLAGAYCYTLLQLGRRAFARDITSGVSLWCAITLVLGPVVAILLAKLGIAAVVPSPAEGPVPAPDAAPTAVDGLLLSVHFVAGFSPRYVIETMLDNVRRRTGYLSSANAVARGVPLTDVRGIVPEIAERLGEEGVLDVAGLALVDPVRLLRNTAFDRRQVLGWIDEAILIVTMPEHWQALEKLGVTGAIDLAWCCRDNGGDHREPSGFDAPLPPGQLPGTPLPGAPFGVDRPNAGAPCSEPIERLAAAIHFDPCMLDDIARRLHQDAQVGVVWALYQTQAKRTVADG
ncbi:MAG: hypothetical protein L6Q99_14010 [Planctomycetes bacterium]|nr:hypothetical protein [Planctomycetota bacterium]